IISYVFYFVIYGLTFLPMLLRTFFSRNGYAGESMLLLLFNPIVFYEEFFMQLMAGESIFGGDGSHFTRSEVGFLTYHLAQGRVWMFLSAACIFLLAFLFLLTAAWKVNPMHSSSGRRRKER
ncbi:MAG: hypothetical protein K2O13_12795, partial [Lachnospiraceae bacterium]|nr:hypothetical protein [Lachnospiraceae bacterium]